MAELRKITRSAPLSNFSQVGPEGGSAFLAFADMAKQAYEFMRPAAMEQMAQEGQEAGAELARRQIGQTNYPIVPKAQPHTAAGDLGSFSPDSGSVGHRLKRDLQRDLGLSEAGAAAIAGNADWESGGFKSLQEIDPLVEGSRGGFGYMQWTGPRRRQFEAYVGERGLDPTSYDANYDFLLHELTNTSEGRVLESLRSASDVGQATLAFSGQFLRPGIPHNAKRIARARGYMTAQEAGVDPGGDRMALLPDAQIEDSAAEVLAPETPPTLVRTKEGKIEPRMFSPLSGEILQAHRAAASTAYLSEMLVKGSTDMMGMSEQYIGNPDGFQQAAQSYIDEVVKSAPGMMRGDLRQKMSQTAQQRYLGMVEESQRDTRQRANNSSRALIERYSTDYAEAMAAGNFDDAAALRGNLEEVLTARESLPGVAWTRDQSENIILNAQDTAVRISEQNRAKVKREQAGTLRTIISAAQEGRTAADEAILDDPNVIAANPELAAEAAAKVALRDAMPGFFALPPSEMDAMIAEERAQPVTEGWQLDIAGAMETARNAAVKALESDPIAYAQERLPQKPPAIDAFSPEDPSGFVSSLKARRDYGNEMVDAGFVDSPAFLSDSEIEAMSAVMSKDSPPEVRAAVAGALVQGFGEDAPQVFKALKVDGVTAWGGSLMAKGGSGSIAAEALRGQALIDEKQVQLPPEKEWRATVQSGFRAVLADLPVDSIQAEAQVLKFAKAIYASRASAPGFEADENSMKDAIQTAMGQTTNPRGEVIGGVQELFGKQTLMPVGVNGERAQRAIQQGLVGGAWEQFGSIFGGDEDRAPAFWDKIGGGQPLIGGEPLPTNMVTGGEVRFVPMGGTRYRMEVQRSSAVMDVHTDDGSLYIVDFGRL